MRLKSTSSNLYLVALFAGAFTTFSLSQFGCQNEGSTDDSSVDTSTDTDTDTDTDSDTDSEDSDPPDITDDPLFDEDNLFADPSQFADMIPGFADFWIQVRDDKNGGFYTYVDREGNVDSNTDKSMVTQSRDGWGFSKAFMITGNEEYLDHADHALAFNYAHAWDQANDGWFYELTETGELTNHNGNLGKWSFGQHYALLGITAMVEATQDPLHKAWLMKGWDSNEAHMWHDDPALYGYYDGAGSNWSNPSGKGFTPTVDGITTNVLPMYLVANQPIGQTRMGQLGANMHDRFITSTNDLVAFGFAENYYSNWALNPSNTWGFVGHVLKTAWCLGRAHLVTDRQTMDWVEMADGLILDAWNNGGYDHTYGGPFTGMTWDDGWIETGEKEYWQVEQAVTGGLMNYYVSDNQPTRAISLQMATESMQFFLDHFVDEKYGEIYQLTYPNGTVLSDTKGDIYKSAYHGIETLYFGYLYGSLYYADLPVELYYRFEPTAYTINVKLTPCSIEDQYLRITDVKRDGVPYNNYNADSRTLTVLSGEGGIFKVTFERR